jgi:hypothetical protein
VVQTRGGKNNYGLLIRYRETCTGVVPPVTYQEQDKEVTTGVATAAVGAGVPTDGVSSAAVGVTTDGAGVTSAAVGVPTIVLLSLGTADGTDKPTFAAATAGIPDAAHANTIAQDQSTIINALHDVSTTVAATDLHQSMIVFTALPAVAAGRTATCAFPIEDNGWGDLAPLGTRTLHDTAASTGQDHHVNHCGL